MIRSGPPLLWTPARHNSYPKGLVFRIGLVLRCAPAAVAHLFLTIWGLGHDPLAALATILGEEETLAITDRIPNRGFSIRQGFDLLEASVQGERPMHDFALLLLWLNTALRPGEIGGLNRGDFDLGLILVDELKTRGETLPMGRCASRGDRGVPSRLGCRTGP